MKNLQTPGKTERVGRYDTAALVVVMVPSVFFSGASASLTLADKLGNVICDSWPVHSGPGGWFSGRLVLAWAVLQCDHTEV